VGAAFQLPHQDVNLAPPPTITVTVTLSSSRVFDSAISIVFEATVIVRKCPGVPTSAQVERVLEFFDQTAYLKDFVNFAGPAFALQVALWHDNAHCMFSQTQHLTKRSFIFSSRITM